MVPAEWSGRPHGLTDSPTPLEAAPDALEAGRRLFLKREDIHELGAFKWRGASPVVEGYRESGATTIVTASTGNHGAATAWAASRLGVRAVVFVPIGAARSKLGLIERFGADVRLVGGDFDAAKAAASAFAASEEIPLFEDGADRRQYEGYRTIASELLDQLAEPPAAVVVPLGNGALLGGIGLELCERSPSTERIGVQSLEAPVMVESWRAGQIVESNRAATFADGLAVRVAIPLAVEVLGEVVSQMILVSEREIAAAVGAYAKVGIRAEGAAGAALAALDRLVDLDGPIVLIVTGRNIDDDIWQRACTDPGSFAG